MEGNTPQRADGLNSPGIVPHLWFDQEAEEAARFYCSVFPESALSSVVTLPDTPSGDCDVVSFQLWGHPFMATSVTQAMLKMKKLDLAALRRAYEGQGPGLGTTLAQHPH